MNNNHNILSAISYLSVLVAPFLVPIIIYFVSPDKDVKRHSMRALLSHLIPIVFGIIIFIGFVAASTINPNSDLVVAIMIATMICYGLTYLALLIWNVVQAIKVLR